jgi:5-methylcytosine-specific restriction enzyme A
MPNAAPKPCTWPGCPALVSEGRAARGRCEKHRREGDRARGTANERGYTYAWTQARKAFLREHPLCAEHERRGELAPAVLVDHKRPHKGDQVLFWDHSNWQALCKACHDTKTATHDGAFGNARRVGGQGT